jgi:glycosyltransferase involved in cell wall biosynthesis
MVSIIIPLYNRINLFPETIASVLNQTYEGWEAIIVDDHSSDGSYEYALQLNTIDNRFKVVKNREGIKGPSSCRNLGAKMAKGKYLLFLDSDDLLASFCLQQRIEKMEEDDNIELGIFKMFEFHFHPGDLNTVYNKDVSVLDWSGSFIKNENPWNVTCPIWKKSLFESVGGFDEEMLFMEDPEIHLRAINNANARIKIYYDNPPDCYYRINNIDDTKRDFWFNSIFYRLLFYRKIISKRYYNNLIPENEHNIKIGIYRLVKYFLYSRKNQFPELYKDLISVMKESMVFSSFEIIRIATLVSIGNAQSLRLRKLKVKGICYKLLPGK